MRSRVGQRYVVYAMLTGYIVFDRLDRVQIGNDHATREDANEAIRVIMRNHGTRV